MAWDWDRMKELALPIFGQEIIKRYEGSPSLVPIPWNTAHIGKPNKRTGSKNFVHGSAGQETIFVMYFFDKKEATVVGAAHYGRDCEGPLGRVHGGALLALCDEAMGVYAGFISGHVCVTRNLKAQFRKFVTIGDVVHFATRIVEETEKDIVVEIDLKSADGATTHMTASGEFRKYHRVKEEYLQTQDQMFDFPREKWKHKWKETPKTPSKL